MRIFASIAGLATLCACSTTDLTTLRAEVETLDLLAETRRAVDVAYRDLPFDTGRVYMVANEHGELHTYSLTPCRNNTHICGGTGRVGHVKRTEDLYIVTGAYPDRTFFLSPGGNGHMIWRGVKRDLAWN